MWDSYAGIRILHFCLIFIFPLMLLLLLLPLLQTYLACLTFCSAIWCRMFHYGYNGFGRNRSICINTYTFGFHGLSTFHKKWYSKSQHTLHLLFSIYNNRCVSASSFCVVHSFLLADWVSEWSASDKTIDSFLSCWLRFFFNYGRHAHTFLIIRLSCKWRIFFFLLRRKSHLDWHYFTQWGLFLWRWENFHKQTIHFSEMTLRLSFLRLLWMSLDNLRNS